MQLVFPIVHYLSLRKHVRIIDDDGTALTSRGEVLGLVKAEAANVADGPERLGLIGCCKGGCCIFHHQETVFLRHGHDGVHVTSDTTVVYWHDCTCSGCDRRFDLVVVDVHRAWFDVDHDGSCTAENKSVYGRDEGKAGEYHLISWPDVNEEGGEL